MNLKILLGRYNPNEKKMISKNRNFAIFNLKFVSSDQSAILISKSKCKDEFSLVISITGSWERNRSRLTSDIAYTVRNSRFTVISITDSSLYYFCRRE